MARSDSESASEPDIPDYEEDDGWDDAEPDDLVDPVVGLFDDRIFRGLQEMLEDCHKRHNFDFIATRQRLGLDFYRTIKLVNYIRATVKDGRSLPSSITVSDFEDDLYLKPVLEDDAVLFNLDELPDVATSDGPAAKSNDELLLRVTELENQLKHTQAQFQNYRETVEQTLEKRWNASPSRDAPKSTPRDDDSHYFSSYAYNDIHETMLKDSVRTDAYRDFIYNNKHLFKDKIVLDVGCGTGILSMFCARAGAKRVFAVDNSAIIEKARVIAYENDLAPPVEFLKGKIEEIVLPVNEVDIIISEWMGYALLYEAMLDSVIYARDRYLRADGLMIPSHVNMWLAPIEDHSYVADHISWWHDVYGFDMQAMQQGIHDEANVMTIPASTLCAEAIMFKQLSLHETSVKDLTFTEAWETKLKCNIDSLDGFAIWFDMFFLPDRHATVEKDAIALDYKGDGVAFTTGPAGKETHWKQAVLLIDNLEGRRPPQAEGDVVRGTIEYAVPETNSRALDLKMRWTLNDRAPEDEWRRQTWAMK